MNEPRARNRIVHCTVVEHTRSTATASGSIGGSSIIPNTISLHRTVISQYSDIGAVANNARDNNVDNDEGNNHRSIER